jgi:hypothetical protein
VLHDDHLAVLEPRHETERHHRHRGAPDQLTQPVLVRVAQRRQVLAQR